MSGFSARLQIVEMPYVSTDSLKLSLQTTPLLLNSGVSVSLSEAEASYVVDRLGGHMGDIAKFLQNRRMGKSVQGWLFPFMSLRYYCELIHCRTDSVDSIVSVSVEALSNVFSNPRPEFDEVLWNNVAGAIFTSLTDSGKVVTLFDVATTVRKTIPKARLHDVEAVARSLAKMNLLRFVNFQTVSLHSPVYAPAFKILKEMPFYKDRD